MNEDASIPDMLLSILQFFAHESCGQSTACRVGTRHILDLANHFHQGRGTEDDLERMVNVSKAMVATSLCPLGQSLSMPVRSAVENFRGDFLKNGNPTGKTPG
jgi:NADH-quinone oxidoreductase subunit F